MSMAAMFDTAREFTLSAADSASRLVDMRPLQISEIRAMLNSGTEREVRVGLQSLFSLIANGTDTRELFAEVVKNVTSSDFTVRRMVYAYLEKYSDYEPELALMTINGIQKTLASNQSPVARAMALRAIASIKVISISSIVGMAISEAANDLSPIVRIACCQAIARCYSLDSSMGPELLGVLEGLLNDSNDPAVSGWALAVLATSFPNRLDYLHKPWRRLCSSLVSFDEWCQTVSLPFMVKYARHFMSEQDPDVKRLLEGAKPLLHSMNSAVVVETAAVYFYLASTEDFDQYNVAPALVCLKQTELTLQNLEVLVTARPHSFERYLSYFYLSPLDNSDTRVLKLRMISNITNSSNFSAIFQELQYYSHLLEDGRSLTAVMQCLASCATKTPAKVSSVIKWLLTAIASDKRPVLVSQALMALRFVLQQESQDQETRHRASALHQLGKALDNSDLPPDALATTLWLVGEYCREQPALATEVLRKQLKQLAQQPAEVRLQIIQLGAKLYSQYLSEPSRFDARVPKFFEHAIYLGRYDSNYDIKDKVRMFQVLLNDNEHELATLMIQARKPPPMFVRPEEEFKFTLDSGSLSVGHNLTGYMSLEPWGNNGDPADREDDVVVEPTAQTTSISKNTVHREVPMSKLKEKVKAVSLAEFLESSSAEESDDEESSEADDSSDAADDDFDEDSDV
ncbi:AP-3 complex subunit beta [Wickerhamiella sorbophila]|uniref:AP-3 complex subunit beta n=1 Tax=Wickerhamiella sorbophila TaxID=45607 RepID=A0A2T0FII4_9ASCO|nr:AP-3 complex subunit beta [Wickerhamiella sorbophila]PRT54814.1 AP-3 complex subunit beta [Wickerhamiella sorbophila]